jgi:hypothetical protein
MHHTNRGPDNLPILVRNASRLRGLREKPRDSPQLRIIIRSSLDPLKQSLLIPPPPHPTRIAMNSMMQPRQRRRPIPQRPRPAVLLPPRAHRQQRPAPPSHLRPMQRILIDPRRLLPTHPHRLARRNRRPLARLAPPKPKMPRRKHPRNQRHRFVPPRHHITTTIPLDLIPRPRAHGTSLLQLPPRREARFRRRAAPAPVPV